ncbi:hypothetical protein HUJ04_008171, partial [Dendroctonus ponderosae]
ILRKWPPAGAVDRVVTKPYTIEPVNADETPINLKIGDVIWIPIFAFHRDPENFENPTKLDPESSFKNMYQIIQSFSRGWFLVWTETT